MINLKDGTRTWTTPENTASLRADGAQSLSVDARDKVLGDQNMGEYLNKVADPNWVDPSKMRKVGNNELDKDAFLKLFLAQLKNQDPTNPLQNHELAAQLAQFTQLEKLSNIDDGIGKLTKNSDPSKSYDALNLIGRGVSADSSKIMRTDTKDSHEIGFNLAGDATEVELSVLDGMGQEVRKLVARDLKAGSNMVSWNGQLEAGQPAAEGEYNVVITATNSSGQKIAADTKFEGRVTGVNFTTEGPVLLVGKQTIKMKDIKKIYEANETLPTATRVDARSVEGKDAKKLASNVTGMGGNLESVAMSQDFINRLGQEAEGQDPDAAKGKKR